MQKLICAVSVGLILLAITSCSAKRSSVPESTSRSEKVRLSWIMPKCGTYKETASVTAKVNERIHASYPETDIDFNFINIYEYSQKLGIYLASGEQSDIVWANDAMLPFLRYYTESVFKYLDSPIDVYAPNIKKFLAKDNDGITKLFGRHCFLPVIPPERGLIPYIKIPADCISYFDSAAFISAVNDSDHTTQKMFDIINSYLGSLSSNGKLNDGIDFAAVKNILSEPGYESFTSSANLIGYETGDDSYRSVDLLNTPAAKCAFANYTLWHNNSYIRNDYEIIRKNPSSSYKYALSGAWGYMKNGSLSTITDVNTDDFIYIAADDTYHRALSVSDSVLILPTTSKYSNESLQILDLFYSDNYYYDLLTFGTEGKNYTKAENTAVRTDKNYLMYENVIPSPDGGLAAIPPERVINNDFRSCENRIGNFIPATSPAIKSIFMDYVAEFSQDPLSYKQPDNSASAVTAILDNFNAGIKDHLESISN